MLIFILQFRHDLSINQKKIIRLQGNFCILKTDIAWGLQKLGQFLENKIPLDLKLVKIIINMSCLYY